MFFIRLFAVKVFILTLAYLHWDTYLNLHTCTGILALAYLHLDAFTLTLGYLHLHTQKTRRNEHMDTYGTLHGILPLLPLFGFSLFDAFRLRWDTQHTERKRLN